MSSGEEHRAETGGLEPRITTWANSIGALMESIILDPDTYVHDGHELPALVEVDAFIKEYGLVESVEEAAKYPEAEWETMFAAGTLHGVTQITGSYLNTMRSGMKADESGAADPKRSCEVVGRSLATLQFGVALRALAAAKVNDADYETEQERAYMRGVQYALDRAIGSFRVLLEERVLRMLEKNTPTVAERYLSAILFIALTEPSRFRVLDSLGPDYADVVERLDKEDYVKCLLKSESQPLRVTQEGSVEAFKWVREVEQAA